MQFRLRNAVIPLLAANIVMYILQAVIPGFTESFLLQSSDVLSRPWILLTSMFLHADIAHLFFNMYALFMFGPILEHRITTRRFLILYFGSGLLAGILSTPFYDAALGASGAIMGVLGATIMLMPDLQVLFFFVIPMSLRTAGMIFALLEILGALGWGIPGVANIAHLVGLGFGLAYGWTLLRKRERYAKEFAYKPKRKKTEFESSIDLDEADVEDYLKNGRI